MCQTVNAIDSLTVDCYLFDDGVANTSCIPAVPASVDATLTVDWNSSRTYNRGVYGFNTNMSRGVFAPLDPPLVAEVAALAPELIRFPGGSAANFYHWNGQPGNLNLEEVTSSNDQAWNQTLAAESFYDAVIPHYYVGPDDPAVSFDDMGHWLFHYTAPGSFLDQAMDATVAEFGAMTPIWVTEWNYMGFQNQVVNLAQLQALYTTSAWMRLAARPQVELAGYHRLVSFGAWPSLLYRDEGVDPPTSQRTSGTGS